MDFKRNKAGRLNRRERGRQDLERKPAKLSEADVLKRFTLLLVSAFIDKERDGATAQVDRARPMRSKPQTETIKGYVAAVTSFN
jgi:hypothetical protein